MKLLFTFCAFLFSLTGLFSQDSTRLLSEFEKFTSTTGKMYKYESISIGKIKDIHISVNKVTDVESGISVKAIQVEQKRSAMFVMVTTGTLVIDMPEVDGVIKSLTFYQATIKEKKPKYEPYYAYITNNDIVIACTYTTFGYDGWSVLLSQRYHYLKSTIPNTVVTIRNKDIDDLADLIKEAKTKSSDL